MNEKIEEFRPGAKGEVRLGLVLRNSSKARMVQYSAIDGSAIFEGDIILGSVEDMDKLMGQMRPKGIVVKDRYRWPRGVIPYQIDLNSYPSADRASMNSKILNAIQVWQNSTNVTMRVRRSGDNDFVTFRNSDGFSSSVGRQSGEQFINLAASCSVGNVIHEIGHTTGLWHEQSREDRDNFVTINWDNIQEDYKHNFNQHLTDGDDSGTYDYGSIMHYGAFAFAIDSSKPTITSPQPIGQRNGFSAADIETINAFYPLWADNVRIPGQQSKASPALGSYGSSLHMVHIGNTSNDIWHSSFNGSTFTTNVKIPDQKSKAAPALASFGGLLHMVHLGDTSNDIWHSTFNGTRWTQNVKIPNQQSKATPAIAVYGGRLHMVHLGSTSNDIWHSTFNGTRWTPNVRITDQQSKARPAIAAFGGLLHMVHLGNTSNDIWHSTFNGTGWTPNVRIPDQQSKAAPALATFSGQLHMVHLGDVSNDIWHSIFDGTWRPNVRIFNQQSKEAPALADFLRRFNMVHLGNTSNDIWYSSYQ